MRISEILVCLTQFTKINVDFIFRVAIAPSTNARVQQGDDARVCGGADQRITFRQVQSAAAEKVLQPCCC